MLRIEPWVYVLGAVLLLTVPLKWLCAAVCAAVVHELCHMLALYLCGARIRQLRVGVGGAVIESGVLEPGQELFCALAGPVGSITLLLLGRVAPRLALCGLVQGVYNLLPVFPLDGGRMLRCLLRGLGGEKLEKPLETGFLILLCILALWSSVALGLGILPLAGMAMLIVKKRTCKQA